MPSVGSSERASRLPEILIKQETQILRDWVNEQLSSDSRRADLISEAEIRDQSKSVLREIAAAAQSGSLEDVNGAAWAQVRGLLAEVSRTRATRGFSPGDTATFVLSLRGVLMDRLQEVYGDNIEGLAHEMRASSVLLDKLGLLTVDNAIQTREETIRKQQEEMLELSTPVVRLFPGILGLPLIGTLDSARTQVVMENLLQSIVTTESTIAIIDITGVPTVDTLTAQHLLKTVAAARLMGADCIISGIRPQIAQTIVHLGVELHSVSTKATLADALALAMQRLGYTVQRSSREAAPKN